jgi:hypothetical protein
VRAQPRITHHALGGVAALGLDQLDEMVVFKSDWDGRWPPG